jgi:hypothetical protein
MPEEGPKKYEIERSFALKIHETNRADAIEFYKALAKSGAEKVPAELLKEEKGSKGIADAESRRKTQAATLSGMPEGAPEFDAAVAKLCLAHYLLERTNKIREIILKENRVGAFSLFLSLKEAVINMLSEKYYGLPADQILDEYDDLEPMLAACSEICGLRASPLTEVMNEYKKRLADELEGS